MTNLSRPLRIPVVAACLLAAATLAAQSVDQTLLLKPLANEWPTYSGDYSGKRYSALTQINQKNVKQLSLAWTRRLVNGPGPGGPQQPGATPIIVGGVGTLVAGWPAQVKGAILQVGGVLYVTTPDIPGRSTRTTAARSGTTRGTRGGTQIGTAASGCGATISTSSRPTTTWCRSRQGRKERCTKSWPASSSSTSSTPSRPW